MPALRHWDQTSRSTRCRGQLVCSTMYGNPDHRFFESFVPADNGMESDDDNALAAQIAVATKAQIAADRERLRRLWTPQSHRIGDLPGSTCLSRIDRTA